VKAVKDIIRRVETGGYETLREYYADVQQLLEPVIGKKRAVEVGDIIQTHVKNRLVEGVEMAYETAVAIRQKMRRDYNHTRKALEGL